MHSNVSELSSVTESKTIIHDRKLHQAKKHLVAIDLGSNSFHLIIAQESAGCLQVLYRQKYAVGLAAGLDDENRLSPVAINRAMKCLREFNRSLNHLSDNAIRIVATHALRKAKNAQTFLDEAKKVFPYPIEIISGKHEAELIYKGVAHTQTLYGKTLIIDIGGGSTEFALGRGFNNQIADSIEMGCVTFKQKFFLNGDITESNMEQAKQFALEQLTALAKKFHKHKWGTVLGTSGSVKAISQTMLELFDDYLINQKRLKQLSKQLIEWQHCDNIRFRSLDPHRRPLLASAVAILSSCLKFLNIDEINFCTGGVREGVLYSLSNSRTDIDTRERTIQNLINLHHIDHTFSKRIVHQINTFKNNLKNSPVRLSNDDLQLLNWAAKLHEVGIAINSKKHQIHGAYIIKNSNMPGFSLDEQQSVALLIRNHKGKFKTDMACDLSLYTNPRLLFLLQLFRLAILLTEGRQQQRKTTNTLSYINNTLTINLSSPDTLMKKLEQELAIQTTVGLTFNVKVNTNN